MSTLRFIIFLLLLFFIHLLFYQYLVIGDVYPDLFLVLVVYSGLRLGPEAGTLAGFACGIIQDSFSYTYFGLHALVKTIIGFTIGKIRHAFFSNRYLVQWIIILVSKTVHDMLFYGIYLARSDQSFWHHIVYNTLPSALYTSVLGLALFALFRFRAPARSW